jgi:hypothetical protein
MQTWESLTWWRSCWIAIPSTRINPMVIDITFSPAGQVYFWKLWDGPDGSDHRMGHAATLGEAFENIVAARTRIALQYVVD